jgi:hypothetical protein
VKYFIILIILFCLGGCSLLNTYPDAVVQGAEKSAEFATINQKNVRAVNDEFLRAMSLFVKSYINEDLAPDALAELRGLHEEIAERFYRPADINAELAAAIAAYLKEPGIGLNKIIEVLEVIAQKYAD